MIYVISDLHGYPFEKFQELLKKLNLLMRTICLFLAT